MVFYFHRRIILDIMDLEMAAHYKYLFPIAYGCEEETMMMVGMPGQAYSEYTEPYIFGSNFAKYIPTSLKTAPENARRYLQSGGIVYNGGVGKTPIIERATPECSTPAEFAAASQASERLVVEMGSKYVEESAENNIPVKLRIQRRVADAEGNTRACHDSFEVRDKNWMDRFVDNGSERLLLAHLATRSCITGAGFVRPYGLRFAQKVATIQKLNAYGFSNSAYRTTSESNTGSRIEIRCNDINVSPWATQVRIGTSALYLTMLQTPLAEVVEKLLPDPCRADEDMVLNLKRFNTANMDEEGQLQPSGLLYEALDFQQNIYDLMRESLGDYVELSQDYKNILNEALTYCDDFRAVLRGEKDLKVLRDRSDIGAKFSKIAASIQASRDMGIARTPHDLISQAWDLRYDLIEIQPGLGNKARVEYGYGFRHRDRGGFNLAVPPDEAERAFYEPPKTTRAFVRGTLIRKEMLEACEWASVTMSTPGESQRRAVKNKIQLHQVVINGLSKSTDAINYIADLKR